MSTTADIERNIDVATSDIDQHDVSNDGIVKERDGRKRFFRRRSFRKIPRSNTVPTHAKPEGNKGRRRAASTSSTTSNSRRRLNPHRRRNTSESSNVSEGVTQAPLKKLRDTINEKYDRRGLNVLNGYIKNKLNMAKFTNNTAYLTRCHVMQVVPNCYRLNCEKIRNTREVVRLLDRFSVLMMEADLKYNKLRKYQVSKFLAKKEDQLKEMFSEEDVKHVIDTVKEAYETKFTRIREAQRKNFDTLLSEYAIAIKNKDEKSGDDNNVETIKEVAEKQENDEEVKDEAKEEHDEEVEVKIEEDQEKEKEKKEDNDEKEDKEEKKEEQEDEEEKPEVVEEVKVEKKSGKKNKGKHAVDVAAGEGKTIEP